MSKYKFDFKPKMQIGYYKTNVNPNLKSGFKVPSSNSRAISARLLIKKMPLTELIEASGVLAAKVKGLDASVQLSPRAELLVKTAEDAGRTSQINLLNTVNRRIVTLNRKQNQPTEDAQSEYKKLMEKG